MHIFDPNIAAEYGIAEAVIIQHFQFWIGNNKRNGRNENDGRTWTYNTTKALAETFPYLSEKQIWLAIDRLVEKGVLMRGNYNKNQYDRTTWYAFTLESFWIVPEGNFHFPRRENRKPTGGEPIPDTLPDTDTNQQPVNPGAGAPGGKAAAKKPAGKKKKAPGAETDTDWQRWVDRYDEHVKKHNDGIGHRWDGAQLGPQGLKGIRAHLVKISTKLEGKTDDDCGFGAWCFILDGWADLPDEWLRGQFDLTVILKKITDILNRFRNATNTNRGANTGGAASGTSAERVNAVANY
jgi:hypothetical protein